MRWTIIYSENCAPEVLRHAVPRENAPHIDDDRIRRAYDAGYFRFDPFYRLWCETGKGGVYRLRDIVTSDRSDQIYVVGFVPLTGFEDDVALVFPIGNGRALALTMERCAPFSEAELTHLRHCYPLLKAMVASHWRVTSEAAVASDPSPASASPLNFQEAVSAFIPDLLTPKEKEIVLLSLAGFDNRAVSERMGVTVGTTKNHKKRLYAKLDVTSERELFSLFFAFLSGKDASELAPQKG